jgi:hypothetical protein
MRILIACEYSGRSREAFRALGHDVISADFEPAEDGSPYHYQGDVFDLINDQQFDLMLAHPPCTYLSVSGLHWNGRVHGRAEKTEKALDFVRRLMDAPIHRIALENPVSCISSRIRKPDQIIQPYNFGEDASKSTCLWLKNLPLLVPTKYIEPRIVCCGAVIENGDKYRCPNCNGEKPAKARWGNQTNSGQNNLGPSEDRWKERSRTYAGIANAWAAQWGGTGISAGDASRESTGLEKQPAIRDLFSAHCLP